MSNHQLLTLPQTKAIFSQPQPGPTRNVVVYRRGGVEDSYTAFALFEETWAHVIEQRGNGETTSFANPEDLNRMWGVRQHLYDYLAKGADQFWLAEVDGRPVGFARSIVRGSVRILTEFFVLPGQQAGGVGKTLLQHALPNDDVPNRAILATLAPSAQSLYLRADVSPRFPVYYFGRHARIVEQETDLRIEPLHLTPDLLDQLATLDMAVLGWQRPNDHRWLSEHQTGFVCYRGETLMGYGYTGGCNGPFLALDPTDFPAILAHAERLAVNQGEEHFGVELPMVNGHAVDYLLKQKFQMDPTVTIMMNRQPFGKLDRYIFISPPFLM